MSVKLPLTKTFTQFRDNDNQLGGSVMLLSCRNSPAYVLSTAKPFIQTQHKRSTCVFPLQSFTPPTQRQLPRATVNTSNQTVRVYKKGDETPIEKLACSLASAFEEDPFFLYVYDRNVDILSKNKILLLSTLKYELSRPDNEVTIHVSEDDGTVAIWHHENHWKIPLIGQLKYIISLFRTFGWKAIAFINAMQHVEDIHPTKPHMHLFVIGTHGATRGKGTGSLVISKMLEYCDRNRVPAYLESSNERNLSFYMRHGFEVVRKIPGLPHEYPPIFAMWREPRLQ